MSTDQGVLCLAMAAWAKASGLGRDGANTLYVLLLHAELPVTVDQAWMQLEEATQSVKRGRVQPPAQQAPPPWAEQ